MRRQSTPWFGMTRQRRPAFARSSARQLRHKHGLEFDRLDQDDTVYVVATDADAEVIGTARLLPTTQPHVLNTYCPQLMGGLPLPRSGDVWELSRFEAADFKAWQGPGQPSPVATGLLRAALNCAAALGAQRLLTIAPLALERLMLRAGLRAHRAAPPLQVDGHPLLACWIDRAELTHE